MKVVLASKNKHKLVEISKITEKFNMELVLQSELGVDIDVEETGILIAVDEILEEKRVRHIDSFAEEHPELVQITSGANKLIYKSK